jgi:hypothetical protein
MKKPASKPLRLETQTIRSLDRGELGQIAGGVVGPTQPLAQSCGQRCSGNGIN